MPEKKKQKPAAARGRRKVAPATPAVKWLRFRLSRRSDIDQAHEVARAVLVLLFETLTSATAMLEDRGVRTPEERDPAFAEAMVRGGADGVATVRNLRRALNASPLGSAEHLAQLVDLLRQESGDCIRLRSSTKARFASLPLYSDGFTAGFGAPGIGPHDAVLSLGHEALAGLLSVAIFGSAELPTWDATVESALCRGHCHDDLLRDVKTSCKRIEDRAWTSPRPETVRVTKADELRALLLSRAPFMAAWSLRWLGGIDWQRLDVALEKEFTAVKAAQWLSPAARIIGTDEARRLLGDGVLMAERTFHRHAEANALRVGAGQYDELRVRGLRHRMDADREARTSKKAADDSLPVAPRRRR